MPGRMRGECLLPGPTRGISGADGGGGDAWGGAGEMGPGKVARLVLMT